MADPEENIRPKQANQRFTNFAADLVYKLGIPYRRIVRYYAKRLDPFLSRIMDDYIDAAIKRNHAENNPELKELLISKISRRPEAHGRILDVIDTIPRTIVRSAAAIALAIAGNVVDGKIHNKDSRIFKWVSFGGAISLIANQIVELCRSVFRYMAGFEGSEKAALEEYARRSRQETPLASTATPQAETEPAPATKFSSNAPRNTLDPGSIREKKEQSSSQTQKI